MHVRTTDHGIASRPGIEWPIYEEWPQSLVPNLFICDGSSLVTSGRGQPTMTIQALAFPAGEYIAGAARRNEI